MIKDEKLFMPVALVREWGQNTQCGSEFNAWKDAFLQKHALIDPEADQGEESKDGQNGKRGGDGATPSPKRPKVQNSNLAPELFVLAADINQPLVQEIKLQKDWPVLQLRGADQCYLVNNSAKTWAMSDAGLAFYGAGSYKILKAGQELPSKGVELNLSSHADTVILNGSVVTLGQAIGEMRQKKPDCRVAYFEMVPGESLNEFQLRPTRRVMFCGKDTPDGNAVARHNCGWLLPQKTCLSTVWHMRWSAKGLIPVKPALHLLGFVELEAGRGIQLSI